MKKRDRVKLRLHRETIVHLESGKLDPIVAGTFFTTYGPWFCEIACDDRGGTAA